MKKKERIFSRYTVLTAVMFLIFSSIIVRLAVLQIIRVEEFKEKANKRAITEVQDFAPRGNILDKNGSILATNKQSYMLVFTETEESKKSFFPTMTEVFKILDENGENQKDDFAIKINTVNSVPSFSFQFIAEEETVRRGLEIRFKRDRGFNEEIQKALFKNKKDKLSEEEEKIIDEELLKITPEEAFNKLITAYGIDKLKDRTYSLDEQRRFMMVKDAIKMQSFSGFKPVTIAMNIKQETGFIFLQQLNELPGIDVTTQPMRNYTYGELCSAVLGYISKISTDKDKYEEKGYDVSSDYIGAAGIERQFEDNLKGTKGGRIVKINKNGRIVEELGRRDPYPGQNIQLTIDKNVQYAAEKSLDAVMEDLRKNPIHSDGVNTSNATRGAAVVIDVNTGGVLALVSRPGYDPNLFATPGGITNELNKQFFQPDYVSFGTQKGLSAEQIDKLFPIDSSIKENTTIRRDMYDLYPKPLYNYATFGKIPPGSTFKPLTAVAGLEEGVIDANTTVLDDGVYKKNNFTGACWIYNEQRGSHGYVNVTKALEVSCNYFFFEVGDRLFQKGTDVLAQYAWKFGLGKDPKSNAKPATGIEIPENFGQMSNLESIKQTIPNSIMFDLVKELKDSKGIDISSKAEDSEAIKILKNTIKNNIKEQMKTRSNNQFSKQLEDDFKNYISKAPDLKDVKFTKGDIAAMVQIVNRNVYNAYTQITTPANVYNASIGQGFSEFTPVQLANYMATLVNGGKRYKVHLVDKFLDSNNELIKEVKPEVIESINLKPSTVETVKEGLLKVTEGESGTATYAFDKFPIETAGKTGSATFSAKQDEIGRTSYGFYVGFAPYKDPKIAVCVVVYDGAHGGFVAPVARAIYESYFKEELDKQNYVPIYDFKLQ